MDKTVVKKLQANGAILVGIVLAILLLLLPFIVQPSLEVIKENLPASVIQ